MHRVNDLFDNNEFIKTTQGKKRLGEFLGSLPKDEYKGIRDSLKPFSRRPLSDLQRNNPNLIIFPRDIYSSKDKIQESFLFKLENEYDDESPEDTEIVTSNLMGFFGIAGTEFHIHSRFDKNGNDLFLHYMLSKVFFPNVVDLPHSTNSENDNLNLLMFAFPYFLNRAINQGIIKEYRTFEYNDSNVRGTIDIQRHIRRNIPFGGKIAYRKREYTHDNSITQLIRHTIEYIRTTQFGRSILEQDEITRNSVAQIMQITKTYSRNDRFRIISDNANPKVHPFYTEYYPLQKLCLQILRYETVSFTGEAEGLYGILFDGAWLWEEYLNRVLGPLNITHSENRNGRNPIHLYKDRNGHERGINYPDFYLKSKLVLDAKYKRIATNETDNVTISSSDYHQVITYMRVLDAPVGGFVYPYSSDEPIDKDPFIGTILGSPDNYDLYHFGLSISQEATTMNDFATLMESNEKRLIEEIKEKYLT